MSVKIRLTRTGGKNEVSYRLVAADGRSPRDGRFLEVLGWYDPKRTGVNFKLDYQRIDYWKQRGAVLSTTAQSLLRRAKKAGLMAEPAPAPTTAPTEPAGSHEQATGG
jgi:small subunit ribosomal protein S16